MVTTPTLSGYRTRLTGLLAQKFFPETNAANDRDEPQALTKGLSEERTRARTTSQRPQTSLLNHSPMNRIPVHGQHIPPAPGFYSFLCPETNPRVAGYLRRNDQSSRRQAVPGFGLQRPEANGVIFLSIWHGQNHPIGETSYVSGSSITGVSQAFTIRRPCADSCTC